MKIEKMRLVAYTLIAVMLLGFVPTSAVSGNSEDTGSNIGYYYDVDENGQIIQNTETETAERRVENLVLGKHLTTSKIAAETNENNVFNITLTVSTNENLSFGLGANSEDGSEGTSGFEWNEERYGTVWRVVDPMCSEVILDKDSISCKGTFAIDADGTITWDILGAEPDAIEYSTDSEGKVIDTIYTYNLSYNIMLNTNTEDFEWNTFYPTNKITRLTYGFSNTDTTINEDSINETQFLIPTVRGASVEELTVTYIANGGDGEPYTTSLNGSTSHTVLDAADTGFIRDGYKIINWNTSADGSGTSYSVGDVINDIYTDITLYAQWSDNNNESCTVTFEVNGGSEVEPVTTTRGSYVYLNQTSTREGYKFEGWFSNKELTVKVYKLTLENDMVVYAKWTEASITYCANGGECDSYTVLAQADGGHTILTSKEVGISRLGYVMDSWNTAEDGTGIAYKSGDALSGIIDDVQLYAMWVVELNTEDHMAYIVGYSDGTVRPTQSISRAEVATIFFRLLSEEARDKFFTRSNKYSDVLDDCWYNNAVSTMTSAEILVGYDDNTFRGDESITRAEFAAIAARFDTFSYIGFNRFSDITGHWAADYINKASARGWINGYEEGVFKPEQEINRAEAIALVNRVLGRDQISADDLLTEEMVTWSDNTDTTKWYYADIQEATNSHEYEVREDGSEYWTAILPTPDWVKVELQWVVSCEKLI